MGNEAVLYPRDEFKAEFRKVKETGGFNGNGENTLTQFKYVFPGIANAHRGIRYSLKTALVLQHAGMQNDLAAIWNQVTLKGIGGPQKGPKQSANALDETTELFFEQIGLGGAQGFVKALANQFWYHIDHSLRQRIDLHTNQGKYGRMDIKHFMLHSTDHLPQNGFPTEGLEMPETASGVLFSTIETKMSRREVQAILEDKTNVNLKYGGVPRVILRENVPDTLFQNQGTHPRMQLFARFESSETPETVSQSFEVPVRPVTREINRPNT